MLGSSNNGREIVLSELINLPENDFENFLDELRNTEDNIYITNEEGGEILIQQNHGRLRQLFKSIGDRS